MKRAIAQGASPGATARFFILHSRKILKRITAKLDAAARSGRYANTATTTCIATPRKAPAPQVRPVMKRFCFQEGFARQSTARPTPAPVHRPATRLEKRRAPST